MKRAKVSSRSSLANTRVEDLILKRLDTIEQKVDRIATDKIPDMVLKTALLQAEGKRENKLLVYLGGATAILTSLGLSYAMAVWK